jgi:hypothetical protein
MKLTASTGNYVPAPEGTTQGVLCDIVDLGLQKDYFNEGKLVHNMKFVFQTEDLMEDGKPYTVGTAPMKASTHTKANAYKIIKTLLGRDLTAEDYVDGEVDLDALILGKNAMVSITHNIKGEKTYANIEKVESIPKKITERLEVRDYVRVQDRAPASEEVDSEEGEVAVAASATGGKKTVSEEELKY